MKTDKKTGSVPEAGAGLLKVSITRGDLYHARYPVIAGHFEDDGILYAEKVISRYMKDALSLRHQLGIYPGALGTSELFLAEPPGFRGAVIIGLGSPGDLTATGLAASVEQGIAKYLLTRGALKPGDGEQGGISSLIVGCGYGGLSIEESVKAIIQGVHQANIKVRNLFPGESPVISHLEFIELYEDKALTCHYAICRIGEEENNPFRIARERNRIRNVPGGLRRIPVEASEGWWNRISVEMKMDKNKKTGERLSFKAATSSAREEVNDLHTTPALLEGIIETISTEREWNPEKAKAIFEMLIPNDLKDKIKRQGNIIWVVDYYSASFPWEMLQVGPAEANPLCVSTGMVRQLSTPNYRRKIKTVAENNALVIADPDLDGFANQLSGALEEGKLVVRMLKDNGFTTAKSLSECHPEIISKLFSSEYKIIHFSGHGIFHKDPAKGSGMLIGRNLFLSSREIQQMSTSPELVFLNCCHLGKTSGAAETLWRERYKLAANLGTQMIENGVRCVIAAGWAVDDLAALEFARIFYTRMFEGNNFGEAIRDARRVVFEKYGHTNTWGAYQCYGDPFYKFEHTRKSVRHTEKKYLIEQEAEADLSNLFEAVETGEKSTSEYLESLRIISDAVDQAEIRNPVILEYEALIALELGDYSKACDKFADLMKTDDARFSFTTAARHIQALAFKTIGAHENVPEEHENLIQSLRKLAEEINTLLDLSPTAAIRRIAGVLQEQVAQFSGENAGIKALGDDLQKLSEPS